MSEPVSALNHAGYEGLAHVAEIGLQGMITLRGDLGLRAVKSAATAASGAKMPAANRATGTGAGGLCWMSPDEVLVLCPYGDVPQTLDKMQTALAKGHALAVNVSDARTVFQVSGPFAREVMAKLCPVDFSPAAFSPGMFRRTRMAQIPAALWMLEDQSIQIICFRSVADYAFEVLKMAAQPGSDVGYF